MQVSRAEPNLHRLDGQRRCSLFSPQQIVANLKQGKDGWTCRKVMEAYVSRFDSSWISGLVRILAK